MGTRHLKLFQLPEIAQDLIIRSSLVQYGEIIAEFSSPYSLIYTLKPKHGSGYLIAKAPKFTSGMSQNDVQTRIIKMLAEINTVGSVCNHSLIHKFWKVEVIFGIPFLISNKRHMNLRDAIEQGPLRRVDMLSIAIQIARGIEYIQAKGVICHQDLKAENIFLDVVAEKFLIDEPYPYKYQAYLADFDLVNSALIFGQTYGSRPYQASEQYIKTGGQKYDKIDVFALAVNMVEMLTGGIHPLGVRTTDVWPESLIDKRWNREDPWKKWARSPTLSTELNIEPDDPVRALIEDMLCPEYQERPNITEVKKRLLDVLKICDEHAHKTMLLYLECLDKGEEVNSEAGWPYMDELIKDINEYYQDNL